MPGEHAQPPSFERSFVLTAAAKPDARCYQACIDKLPPANPVDPTDEKPADRQRQDNPDGTLKHPAHTFLDAFFSITAFLNFRYQP
jgi:hypothetical protein